MKFYFTYVKIEKSSGLNDITSLHRDVAQLGSASGLGPEGRRFESCHPDSIYGSLAQLGEHLPYKQRVTGSSPVTPIFKTYVHGTLSGLCTYATHGRVPEWPKGTDCKSAAYSFGGSNPPSPIKTFLKKF